MRLMEREDFRMKENKMSRRSFLKVGAFASAAGMLAAAPAAANAAAPNAANAAEEENGLLGVFGGKLKYVFLFIGDGMGTAQIQSARFYKGTVENNGAVVEGELSFTQFPEVGSVTTYDSTSFCPDSASTATSIATGHKTESGVINMCPWTRDVPYETIAEKLHAQKNYKVGVVSSVNIDHATPAAFYGFRSMKEDTMKTTFKKSALAFLTCILALAFALTGCSGGGKDPKANFVGSWKYSGGTLDGEELTEEYMDMLKEWGVNCILILDEDGTGTLDLFLEVADLKWEAKDATTVTITAEDESHDLKLKDDKLVLEVDGDKLIFTKSDKDLSGTVKKDRENAEKEEEIDEAVEDGDVQSVEISPAVTVADDDLCTITITEKFQDDWGDIGFVVNITNKSDKDLTFYAPTGKTNVNGTMKEAWFSAHLMPGTNATEEFTFSKGTLDSFDSLVNTTIGIDAYLTDSYEDVASYSATIA